MLSTRVAVHRVVGGLVKGDPVLDTVAEAGEAEGGILDERRRRRLAQPPVVLHLQRERKVPVVERGDRVDAVGDELVDQIGVELDALLVDGAIAGRQDSRPRDRKSIVLELHLRHQPHVAAEAVEVVSSHVASLACAHLARRVRKGVPD